MVDVSDQSSLAAASCLLREVVGHPVLSGIPKCLVMCKTDLTDTFSQITAENIVLSDERIRSIMSSVLSGSALSDGLLSLKVLNWLKIVYDV